MTIPPSAVLRHERPARHEHPRRHERAVESAVRAPLRFPSPRRDNRPLVLWHLLSLDAPTVAALWTWSLARVNHIHLPVTALAAMAIAVWVLYAADRVLDARMLDARMLDARLLSVPVLGGGRAAVAGASPLEARHHFHHRHRSGFLVAIGLATVALACLLPHLEAAAIRLYLIEGSFLAGYFVMIHATRSAHRLPKELAVGPFFAAATFIPTIARDPGLRLPLLAPAILFSVLCSLNCLFIYAWEHASSNHAEAHPATRIALRSLHALTLALIVAALALLLFDPRAPWPIPAAIASAAALLLLLDRGRRGLSRTTLRAAADLALLTPLLFLL